MTSRNPIDTAIDEVAREMTAGDSSANLRARVLADIERPRPFAWRPVFATACAVGAAIALLVVALNRPSAPSTEPPALSAKSSAPSAQPPALSPKPPALSPKPPAPSLIGNPFAEPPLKEESIAVDPIAVTPMAPTESIVVEELPSITPIAVAPLGPGEER